MTTPAQAAPAPFSGGLGYRHFLVALLLFVSIIAYSDRLILGFLVDSIKSDLDLSDTQIGLLTGLAFSLFYSVMGLPLGRAIDIFPRNIVLAACVAAWSVATALCGLATGAVSLFLARCGVGAGEAAMNPSAVSLIADRFPRDKVVRALSTYSLGSFAGGGVAILLGGQLIAYLNGLGPITIAGFTDVPVWRIVFVLLGIPGLIAALIVLVSVRELPDRHTRGTGGTVAPPEGFTKGLAFIWEGRAAYLPLFGGTIAFGFYNYAVLGWYPAMFGRSYGVGPDVISVYYGTAYLVSGIAGTLMAAPLVRWFDRRSAGDATVMVLVLASVVACVPGFAGPLMPHFAGAVGCFLVSMAMSSMQSGVVFSALVLITGQRRRGTIIAVYVMVMNLTGASLGNVIIGLLSDHVFGPAHLNRAIALVAVIALPLSALSFLAGRKAFRVARAAEEKNILEGI